MPNPERRIHPAFRCEGSWNDEGRSRRTGLRA
jgi:hypothetical protein